MKNLSILFLAVILFTSCSKDDDCVSGNGGYVSRNYNTAIFDALSVSGEADVVIKKDSIRSVRIEAQQNVLNTLDVEVRNGVLTIGDDDCIKNSLRLKIYISTPTLTEVHSSGSVNVLGTGTFVENIFKAHLSGTGSMELNVLVQEFNASISGDGAITASGSASQQHFATSGEGDFSCFDLIGEDINIDVSGQAKLEVHATESLDIEVSGSATIYYKGHPSITQDISGTATIVDAN